MHRTFSLHLFLFAVLFLSFAKALTAATTISGTVLNGKKEPVPFANVYIKGSYDGATTDNDGKYSFSTDLTGRDTIICRIIGYAPQEKAITISGAVLVVNFVLQETVSELNVVTISAGTIEASDEKRTTVLKPLDIVTTAGGQGDIYGAIQTLPGATRVGNQDGLFVRGGTGAETKTIIDGMNVANPFYGSVPDVAARGRFSPFIFKGTVFSTGGYSAQYGQALSSVLVLNTDDLPDKSTSTLAITSVGVGGGHDHLWEKQNMSAGFDLNYTNLGPYFKLVPQLQNYTRMPQFIGGDANFRKKTGDNGILKFYGYFNYSDLALTRPDVDSTNGYRAPFGLNNLDVYTNLSWRQYVGEKWRFDAGSSWSYDRNRILANIDSIHTMNSLSQGKLMATRYYMKRNQFRVGAEYQYLSDNSRYDSLSFSADGLFYDNYVAGFAETDIYFGTHFVLRAGGRAENSSLLAKTNIAPRVSLALQTGKHSEASIAYGDFYEKPADNLLYVTHNLDYEKATHYILNFQHVDDSLTFRIEAYYKTYNNLVKTLPAFANTGSGYARGVDVFFRDKKTFRNVDYWISYTYLDTKRNYLNYPVSTMPTYASPHNVSVVFKKFFPGISTSVGFSYFYTAGRPYYNPNNPVFLGDRTYDYNSFNLNASYLTSLFGAFTVVAVSVTNVFGFNQVYGYRYSYDGLRREAIIPPSKRSVFIGLFMSFGRDRSQDVINNNN